MSEIVSTNWNYPTPIWFGLSRRLEIIEALNELSITIPMIVTDPNFAENENFVDILAILKKSHVEFSVFSNIKGCLLYTSPSPRDLSTSRMPSSA